MKFLILLGCLAVGYLTIRYSEIITNNTTRFGWFDAHFPSGTYGFWKVFGAVVILFGFWYLFN